MVNISQRLKKLESQMARGKKGACRQDRCRLAVRERLFSLFHSCPAKRDRWEKFKALYLSSEISGLNDLCPEGVQALKQVFID